MFPKSMCSLLFCKSTYPAFVNLMLVKEKKKTFEGPSEGGEKECYF